MTVPTGEVIIFVVLSASLGGIAGGFYGRSLERDDWQRIIARTPSCLQQLEKAAKEVNEWQSELRGLRPDRP